MRYSLDDAPEAENAIEVFPDGPLSLNFTNTVSTQEGEAEYDYLRDFSALVYWCRHAGAISAADAKHLAAAAKRRPREAASAARAARDLRGTIYGIATALSRGEAAPRTDLMTFNMFLKRAMRHTSLAARGDALTWDWCGERDDLEAPLWRIVRDAATLFTSSDVDRIVQCEGDDCTWLFLDTTKNRSKRFCRSAGCGNRTRVRRYYERIRG